jgi:small ligand-binding sensory domain FIST
MDEKAFVSAWTAGKDWRRETEALALKAREGLGARSCDLAVFFVSEAFGDFEPEAFCGILSGKLRATSMIGCNASGIIADDREVEGAPAISVLAMHLPGVKLSPFVLSASDADAIGAGPDLINFLDLYPTDRPHFLCFADPASCDISKVLNLFNEGYKGLPIVGGLASGGVLGVETWLALNGAVYREGLAGLAMTGAITFEIIVSQGCRPIGRPLVVTSAKNNVIYELAGRPALQVVQELLQSLPPKDRALSEQALFVGLVMNEKQSAFKRGDFLVRNLVGFDPESGALAIGALPKVGQTVQFQLRDAATSAEDLEALLGKYPAEHGASARGALLVSCCGRGKGLYGQPDHDARVIQSRKGPLPLAGFFANGEIGPVGNKNFVHGYTSSLVIFK